MIKIEYTKIKDCEDITTWLFFTWDYICYNYRCYETGFRICGLVIRINICKCKD